ncbi:hypothetical protein [Aquicella lusitana]|uniref:Uncharacterized protein n=1 Tax=Aquicella lusitana TaxID=254246 RepID=A0A370GZW5_9COXI|nr:hypothetical protein [Aquicella lusitana]RDI48821.1 hypothetical protein C8D86_101100 [Aquicella lusitana]VVC73249.1 hypothetical protein AQULUS_09810 [Aquicella lusitana]
MNKLADPANKRGPAAIQIISPLDQNNDAGEEIQVSAVPNNSQNLSIREIITNYYESGKTNEECYEDYNFKLSTFSFSRLFPRLSSWIGYERLNPEVNINDDDWKINLAIHYEDLGLAFAILSECAQTHQIALFKVMSIETARHNSQNKDMTGREIVLYRNGNPEFTAEKWIEILKEIEEKFRAANIRPSTETSPITNRRLGKYVSYTHPAWIPEEAGKSRYNIPFSQGIRETVKEDEDIFTNYFYDNNNECISTAASITRLSSGK